MKKREESIIKMACSTSSILESFSDVVTLTPGLPAAKTELDSLIADARRHIQKQLPDGTEITEQKNNVRSAVEICLRKVSSALVAFATASTDATVKPLISKYSFTKTYIEHMRDIPLFALAYVLYGDAQPHADKLAPHATLDDVTNLKDLADDFNEFLPQKSTHGDIRAVATQNIGEAVVNLSSFLKNTVDNLVNPWEFNNLDFYRAYKNARIITDPAFRKQ